MELPPKATRQQSQLKVTIDDTSLSLSRFLIFTTERARFQRRCPEIDDDKRVDQTAPIVSVKQRHDDDSKPEPSFGAS